jgi:hypothetical protein
MKVQTTQIRFASGYMEARQGGTYSDGLRVHLVVHGEVSGFDLTTDEAREVADYLTTLADHADAVIAAKDRAYDEEEKAALAEGKSEEEAANIAGRVAEEVTVA